MASQGRGRVIWVQAGACSGDTMSLISAGRPSLEDLSLFHGLELLWHPSISSRGSDQLVELAEQAGEGKLELDILCVEGSLITAPYGSGMFDSIRGMSKISLIQALADCASYVVAVGTCASFGGIHSSHPNPSDSIGLQFDRAFPGGLLPIVWRSRSGLPVINLPGCPAHHDVITKTLMALLAGGNGIQLDAFHRPATCFQSLVHQGCTRNEYHEYDVEEGEPGGRACLFFNMGCQGPLTHARCNVELWNERSSKTRAGVPCMGCTSPDFPKEGDLFRTEKIGDIPERLPLGVERGEYMAYKSLAREAAPERVKSRKMKP